MSAIKTIVEERSIPRILAAHFDASVSKVRVIRGGHIAQTFVFEVEGRQYVLRFNADNMDANFEKEEFVSAAYTSLRVPVPQVVAVGRHGALHYCITARLAGRRMDQLTADEVERALPAVLETLLAIHETDVGGQEGFGLFDGHGRGFFPDWATSLARVREEERADGFYGKWHHLFENSCLKRGDFDRVFGHMEGLLGACPNERFLVHGGFGFGNLLVDGDRVTGVIDWLDAKYGDFLYDVAWLDSWDRERGYPGLCRTAYERRSFDLSNFEERVLCYQCYLALDALRFFGKTDNLEAYTWTMERISGLLSNRTSLLPGRRRNTIPGETGLPAQRVGFDPHDP